MEMENKEDGKAKDEKEISEHHHHAKDDEVRLIFFILLNPKTKSFYYSKLPTRCNEL
jgi:hypothetical protein